MSFQGICANVDNINNSLIDGTVTASMAQIDSNTPDSVIRHIADQYLAQYQAVCQSEIGNWAQASGATAVGPSQLATMCNEDNFTSVMGWLAPPALQMQVSLAKSLRDSSDLSTVKADPLVWLGQQRHQFQQQTNWCQQYPDYPSNKVNDYYTNLLQTLP